MTKGPGDEPLLSARNISVQFVGLRALDSVSLDLNAGEVHGLLGGNGAGKSTLINVLSGALRPDSGSLRVAGREVALGSLAASQNAGLVVVHQELMLFPDRTVEENIFASVLPRGAFQIIRPSERRRKAEAAMERLGAIIDLKARVGSLPLAHRQLVEIARALCQGGSVLILDEPTSSLSRPEAKALFGAIRTIVAKDAAVVFVSHRLDEVFEITDALTVLRDGRVEGHWRTKDADIESVTRVMVGELADRRLRNVDGGSAGDVVVSINNSTPDVPELNLSIRAGEVLGMAGLEGSGVAFVMQMLGGVIPVQEGIRIDGRSVGFKHPSDAIRQGVIYMPPDRKKGGLWLEHDSIFNIGAVIVERMPFGWLRRNRLAEAASQRLAEVGVRSSALGEPISRLSGGNQQRVLLGRALEARPRVLLLNDFTRGVDVSAKASIHRVVRNMAASGIAVCVTSSDLEELLDVADRIVCMRAGKVVANRASGEFDKRSLLEMASVGRRT